MESIKSSVIGNSSVAKIKKRTGNELNPKSYIQKFRLLIGNEFDVESDSFLLIYMI